MTAAVTIRDARIEDERAILTLWDAAYQNSARSYFDDIAALLAHPGPCRLLVAETDGDVVGTLIVTFDGWRGNMYRLAVLPSLQRQGIARQLVERAHDWLRSVGCRRITALVEGDHVYATSFWESAGYEHDTEMRRYHRDLS